MLSVYTRHSEKCPHRDDIAWRRCRCPKWILHSERRSRVPSHQRTDQNLGAGRRESQKARRIGAARCT